MKIIKTRPDRWEVYSPILGLIALHRDNWGRYTARLDSPKKMNYVGTFRTLKMAESCIQDIYATSCGQVVYPWRNITD
jgi:hypothetical protein